jgi:hypothetical protein
MAPIEALPSGQAFAVGTSTPKWRLASAIKAHGRVSSLLAMKYKGSGGKGAGARHTLAPWRLKPTGAFHPRRTCTNARVCGPTRDKQRFLRCESSRRTLLARLQAKRPQSMTAIKRKSSRSGTRLSWLFISGIVPCTECDSRRHLKNQRRRPMSHLPCIGMSFGLVRQAHRRTGDCWLGRLGTMFSPAAPGRNRQDYRS